MLKPRLDVLELFQKSQRGAVKAEMARKRILTTSFLDGKINKEFTNAISEKSYGAENRLFCIKKREVGEERKPLFISYYFKELLVQCSDRDTIGEAYN